MLELRNEESADIVPYTHSKCVDKIVVPMDKDIKEIREKLLAVMEIYTKRLSAVKAIQRGHNPTTYSKYAMLMSSKEWKENPRSDVSGQVRGQASVCTPSMALACNQPCKSNNDFFRVISVQ